MERIRLIEDIPVEDKHGMKKGRVFKVRYDNRDGTVLVRGDAGEDVKILYHEYVEAGD